MRVVVSSLVLAALVAGSAIPAMAAKVRDRGHAYNGQAYNGESYNGGRRDCIVTGWTDWTVTRPIWKCPDDEPAAKNFRRR